MKESTKINWKLYRILLAACIFSIAASLPYAFSLAEERLKSTPIPFPLLIIISILQSSVIFAIILFFGLKLSKKTGLKTAIIEKLILHNKTPELKPIIKLSILSGVLIGVLLIAIDFIFTKLGVEISFWTGQIPVFWKSLLASFYGGIGEEILLRLFFVSLLALLFAKIKKSDGNISENSSIMWTSIIIASVIFGLGHIPITAAVTPLTPLVVVRALLLNGFGGIVFGWLFWKKGLLSAMIAHFSTDMVMQVIFPGLLILIN